MRLDVKYSNQSSRFLIKCEKEIARRLLDRIEKLRDEPFPQNMKRIEGQKFFRVRVGKHRILYEVDKTSNLLGIVKIDKREKIYD